MTVIERNDALAHREDRDVSEALREPSSRTRGSRSAPASASSVWRGGPAFCWAEAVCWTLRKARKPYILTLHGGNLPSFARRWPKRIRGVLGSACAVTSPSRYLQEELRSFRDDIRLIPNPLDIPVYGFRSRDRPELRLGWLRAFSAIYNPCLAIRVSPCSRSSFQSALTMIGPDKGDGSLEETRKVVEDLGVLDQIALVGGVIKCKYHLSSMSSIFF